MRKISHDKYTEIVTGYTVVEEVIGDKTVYITEDSKGDRLNIDPNTNMINVYALVNEFSFIKGLEIGVNEDVENEMDPVKEFLLSYTNKDESDDDFKYMLVLDRLDNSEAFADEVRKFCDDHLSHFKYPSHLYVKTLDSWEEYLALDKEVKEVSSGITTLLYYNPEEEIRYFETRRETLEEYDLKITTSYGHGIINLVAGDTENDPNGIYISALEFTESLLGECKKGGHKRVGVTIPFELRSEIVASCCAYVHYKLGSVRFKGNMMFDLAYTRWLKTYENMNWNLMEHRYKNAHKSGFKIYRGDRIPYICLVNSTKYNLVVDAVKYSDYLKYLESGQTDDYHIETISSKYNNRVKLGSIADALALDKDLRSVGSYHTHCAERVLPLIKLMERLFKNYKNMYTLKDLIMIGSKDSDNCIIGVATMKPVYDIVKFKIGEKGIKPTTELVRDVSGDYLYNLSVVDTDRFEESAPFREVCKVLASTQNKPYDEAFQKLCNGMIHEPKLEDMFLDYSLYNSIEQTPDAQIIDNLGNTFYRELANDLTSTNNAYVKEVLLKYCSLYGIRQSTYNQSLIDIYGNLRLTQSRSSNSSGRSTTLKMKDMITRIYD